MRSALKEVGERFLRKHTNWGRRGELSAFLILQRCISVSTSMTPDPYHAAKVGKCTRLSMARSPWCLTQADALHEYLLGVPHVASDFTTRMWQQNPQPALSVSLEELPTGNLHLVGEADKRYLNTCAVVAFDKP